MKVVINFTKQYFLLIISIVLIIGAVVGVAAFNSGGLTGTFEKTKEQAATFGHSSDEVVIDLGATGTAPCTGKVTLQNAVADGCISGGSSGGTSSGGGDPPGEIPNEVGAYRFITKYSTLMADSEFKAWISAQGGSQFPANGGDDHGWYIRNVADVKFKDTTTKLCTYFMGDGSIAPANTGQYTGQDYGSDNNNVAYYWDISNNLWKSEAHGDNGAIDVISLLCTGQLQPRGYKFLTDAYKGASLSLRKGPEACSNIITTEPKCYPSSCTGGKWLDCVTGDCDSTLGPPLLKCDTTPL